MENKINVITGICTASQPRLIRELNTFLHQILEITRQDPLLMVRVSVHTHSVQPKIKAVNKVSQYPKRPLLGPLHSPSCLLALPQIRIHNLLRHNAKQALKHGK